MIEGTDWSPERVMEMVLTDFPLFSPEELASFARCTGDTTQPIRPGEELEVNIKGTGCHRVVAVDITPRSLTLRTVEGHPEAGRITFGADYDEYRRLVFRIRSRARSRSVPLLVGFLLMGKRAQERIWTRFVENVARGTGGRIRGQVATSTTPVDETAADREAVDAPTFDAAKDG